MQILRADDGQGRGDPRQMFDATSIAEGALHHATEDGAGACLVAHYRALASLTDPDGATPRLRAALDLAHRAGDARLVTLMEAFIAVADLTTGRNEQARGALARLESAAELIGTAAHGRFNATAHYILYRAVLEPMLRHQLDEPLVAAGMARGRTQNAAEALAAHGVVPPVDAGRQR